MVFYWSLSDCKSPQVSRTLFSILAVLNNVVVWMVSLVRQLSSPPVPRVILNLLYRKHQSQLVYFSPSCSTIFNSLARSSYPSLYIFQFYSVGSRNSKVDNFANFFLFFCWLLYGLVFWPRLGDLSVHQSPIGVYESYSRTGTGLCIHHLFVWSNLNFLHISQLIPIPTQSCLIL